MVLLALEIEDKEMNSTEGESNKFDFDSFKTKGSHVLKKEHFYPYKGRSVPFPPYY